MIIPKNHVLGKYIYNPIIKTYVKPNLAHCLDVP